jgi:hypothetical protein
LPKAGLNGFDWAFVQGSTFVLRLNFGAKNPRLRKAAKRYLQSRQKFRYKLNFNELNLTGVNLIKTNFSFSSLTSK